MTVPQDAIQHFVDRGFVCGVCQKKFKNNDNVRKHIKKFHMSIIPQRLPTEPEPFDKYIFPCPNGKDYFCSICHKEFKRRPDTIKHIKAVHKQYM